MAGEDVLFPELERELAKAVERVAVDPSTVLGDFELSESDRAQLARPERIQVIRESISEQAATGVAGWVDDDLAIVDAWGFAVDRITVPVLVRYGATDVLVPPAHGEWLAANVPGCVVKVDDTAGHMGSDPVQDITENLRWLRDGVPHPEADSAQEGVHGGAGRDQAGGAARGDLAGDRSRPGYPPEKALRTCLIALLLSEELGLDRRARSDIFYASLIHPVGCSAFTYEAARRFGTNELVESPRTRESTRRGRPKACARCGRRCAESPSACVSARWPRASRRGDGSSTTWCAPTARQA